MKIMICGKGGSGKSTIAAMLAHYLSGNGYRVLLIDADESNYGLHRLAGVEQPVDIMQHVGGKKGFKQKMNPTFPGEQKPFQEALTIDELPENCVTESGGVRLAAIGKINDFGEGCACAMGMLSKLVLSRLVLGRKDIVIIDTEAGIEHFGRRVDGESDMILGIVDPTYESFVMARKMTQMAHSAGTEIFLVLNKIDDAVRAAMLQNVDADRTIAMIPHHAQVFQDSLNGNALQIELPELEPIRKLVQSRIEKNRIHQ